MKYKDLNILLAAFLIIGAKNSVGQNCWADVESFEAISSPAIEYQTRNSQQLSVTWTTSSAYNIDHFVMEGSNGGTNFEEIDNITAFDIPFGIVDYSWSMNKNPLSYLIRYLRLRAVCEDGGEQIVHTENLFPLNNPSASVYVDYSGGAYCKQSKPWTLVYNYEFNESQIDRNTWRTQPWGFESYQHISDVLDYITDGENLEYNGGQLRIWGKEEQRTEEAVGWKEPGDILPDGLPNLRTFSHTSGMIESLDLFKHGRFEIKCEIPQGQGFWPAFWMYSELNGTNNEIDVFEFWNPYSGGNLNINEVNKKPIMTVHYAGDAIKKEFVGQDYSQGMHTFAIEWDPYMIKWKIDGETKNTVYKYYDLSGNAIIDCHNMIHGNTYLAEPVFPIAPMSIIAGFGIQEKNAPINLPQSMDIEYIRIYQQVDCEKDLDICSNNMYPNENRTITGRNLTFSESSNCNWSLASNHTLNLLATNSVSIPIDMNFPAGSEFHAKIIDCPTQYFRSTGTEIVNESNQDDLYEQPPNSIKWSVQSTLLMIYPNPSEGVLNIFYKTYKKEPAQLKVFNSAGKLIRSINHSTLNETISINISDEPKGIYYVRIQSGDEVSTKKIILQ